MTTFFSTDHDAFRDSVRTYLDREVTPKLTKWDKDCHIPRDPWVKAGDQGFLGVMVPDEFGGNGSLDFRYRCVLMDELARIGAAALSAGISMNEDIVAPYLVKLGTPEQQHKWLTPMSTGRAIAGIAMTEPGAGSDLRGIQTVAKPTADGGWALSGSKTFITNGIEADFVIVVARTDPDRRALGLFLVESDQPGFTRGRQLEKLGMHAQDTAELFFDDVKLSADSVIGDPYGGFGHLMDNLPSERLGIAYYGFAGTVAAIDWTVEYTRQRRAFGQRIIDFQNTKFQLAELVTELDVSRSFMHQVVHEFNAHELTAVSAAKAKWWMTEMQKRTVDRCLQLFGGFGYMAEYPISRAYIDARVQTIYGGTTEIMKEIIGRSLGA